jgi:hypothetical protein
MMGTVSNVAKLHACSLTVRHLPQMLLYAARFTCTMKPGDLLPSDVHSFSLYTELDGAIPLVCNTQQARSGNLARPRKASTRQKFDQQLCAIVSVSLTNCFNLTLHITSQLVLHNLCLLLTQHWGQQ